MRELGHLSFLERCGLTLDDLARVEKMVVSVRSNPQYAPFGEPAVRMLADIRRSRPDRPHQAIARGDLKIIRVAITGELLSFADAECKSMRFEGEHCDTSDHACPTHYAVLSVPMNGAAAFTLLADAPAKGLRCRFIPAHGTAVVYHSDGGSPTALRAAGVDTDGTETTAWTLDAFTV